MSFGRGGDYAPAQFFRSWVNGRCLLPRFFAGKCQLR